MGQQCQPGLQLSVSPFVLVPGSRGLRRSIRKGHAQANQGRKQCCRPAAPSTNRILLLFLPTPLLQKFKMREAAIQELGLQADVAAVVGQAA